MSRNGRAPTDVYSPYEVIKVHPGKPVKFISVCNDFESVVTHWYGRHSVRCDETPLCQLCLDRNDKVWKGYLLGTAPTGGQVAIFQITPLSAVPLQELVDNGRGLRGAIIKLERKGQRANSPLTAELRGWARDTVEIPYENLERVVNVLYKQYSRVPKDRGDGN